MKHASSTPRSGAAAWAAGTCAAWRRSPPRAANLELVAVCDLKAEQADLLADEAKELLGTRPRVFTDIAQMVREMPDLQAADVTVERARTMPWPRPAWRPACT